MGWRLGSATYEFSDLGEVSDSRKIVHLLSAAREAWLFSHSLCLTFKVS